MKLFFLLSVLIMFSCSAKKESAPTDQKPVTISLEAKGDESVATFASGCFWCVEEVFESLLGVREVFSGYSGGTAEDATYEKVSNGETDHAESVQIYYDTTIIDFRQLVKAFFASHDPTTLNQQGPDKGRQYRSIAFYRNEAEKKVIEEEIKLLTDSAAFSKPIVTEITPFTAFYPAEEYHQDYIARNPNEPYVRSVSIPRFEKFRRTYQGQYKEEK